MTERQITGAWFVITGVLLSLFWFLAYGIVNWFIDNGSSSLTQMNLSDEHAYIVGAAAVVSVQFLSLLGIPFILVGLAQIATGLRKEKKRKK